MPEEFANQLIRTQESILYKQDTMQTSLGMKASADGVRKLTRSVEELRTMLTPQILRRYLRKEVL